MRNSLLIDVAKDASACHRLRNPLSVAAANHEYRSVPIKERLPGEFADQMAKSRWLRIRYVNHVFALTLTFKDPNVSDVEIIFISFKLDDMGGKVVEDNRHVAQIRAVGITGISDETQEALREQYEMSPLISLLALWTRPSTQKLGILKFYPVTPDNPHPKSEYEDWEKKAISAYIERHNL